MKTKRLDNSTSFALVAALLSILLLVVVIGSLSDRAERSSGPELPLSKYIDAISREDIDSALDQLAPELRRPAASFVAWELGNRYTVLESAVRTESLVGRWLGRSTGQTRLVVAMEIETAGQVPWRATEELPVQNIDGRWYLMKVPLGEISSGINHP